MKAYQPNTASLAEMVRIEAIIAEHGPSTSHFIGLKMGMDKSVTNARLNGMRRLDRLHVSFRAKDALTNSNTISAHYALGVDPGLANERNPKRGILPFRPVVKTWDSAPMNADPLHAAFFGRMA